MTAARAVAERLRVPAGHPCLPGHFPGRPIVPGVLLLDRVAAALEGAGFGALAALGAVKFLAPLAPERDAGIHIAVEGRRIRFRVESGEDVVMTGEGTLA